MSNEWVLGRNQAFYFMQSSVQNFNKELYGERHGHRKQIKYNWETIWGVFKHLSEELQEEYINIEKTWQYVYDDIKRTPTVKCEITYGHATTPFISPDPNVMF